MYLLQSALQGGTHRSFRADGSLSNTSPKLVVPQATSRAFFVFQNSGTNPIYLEHGCARATATITAGVVTSISILNPGFGFVRPPVVQFKGGGGPLQALTASGWDGRGQIENWQTPQGDNLLVSPPVINRIAKATAVLTSGVVTSFNISDGGAGYINPPEVLLMNDPNDPFGCADPSAGGGAGTLVNPGGSYFQNGTFCHTDAIAVFAAAGTASYYFEYAP